MSTTTYPASYRFEPPAEIASLSARCNFRNRQRAATFRRASRWLRRGRCRLMCWPRARLNKARSMAAPKTWRRSR